MRKTGIYGGTFNPIHLGHIHILQEFIERLSLDRVLLIPTKIPPHKQATSLASAQDRLYMCSLAAKEIVGTRVEVSKLEICREGKSYTAETIKQLRLQYPHDEFFLLMGEDMFLTVDKWYCPEIIFSETTLCASPRSKSGMEKLREKQAELETRFCARCILEDIPYLEISSTAVRELAERNVDFSVLVPLSVADYIKKNSIYTGGLL